MSIYANRMTQDRVDILGDYITDPITPPRFELGEKRIMPDGTGRLMYGDDVDFLSLKMQYPDQFNTGALSEMYHAVTPDMDSSSAGISGANISMDLNNSVRLTRRNVTEEFFTSYFGQPLASSLANNAFSETNVAREVTDLGGTLGNSPSVSLYNSGRVGEDRNALAIAGGHERTWEGHINARAYQIYKQNFLAAYENRYGESATRFARTSGTVDVGYRRARNTGSDTWRKSYIQAAYELDRLSEPEFNEAMAGTPEDRSQLTNRLYASGRNDVLLDEDDLDRFDSTLWQMLDYEARDERGLSGVAAKQFVYERAQRQTIRKLHFLLNGDTEKAGDPAALASQIQNLSETVGPDFLEEALSRVVVTDDSWKETVYDNLGDLEKEMLMKSGITHEMLADNTTNPFSYMMTANLAAQKQAAMDLREMMFEKDYHEGWFNWTRRLSDTIHADIANDPYAMYFLTGAVPVGVAAGIMFSSGTVAATTTVGRIMAYTAIDGAVAGAAEGYAASIGGQTSLIMEGARTELDFTGVYTNMALYGGMGAIGGAGLAGAINRIGPAFRGTGRVAIRMTDYVADTGVLGEAARVRGLNRLAEREATVPEIEGAQIFSNIENRGLAIRLNRGEVEAKDVLAETIPLLVVRKEGEDLSETIEDLFSAETLAKYGLSSADAVDLVFGIQKKLGPGAQIGTEEFDSIIQAVFREAKDLASDGAETAQQRLDMLDRTLKAKGIDTAKRFVGGSGRSALSDKETVTLKALLNKLKDSGVPGRPILTQTELKKLLRLIPRINDEKSLRGAQKILNNSGRLNEADALAFNKRLDDIVSRGTKAREDSFLQDLLKVENALSLFRNERAIRVALDLGVSAKQIMKYIREYKGLVGNVEEIAKLNSRFPDISNAIKQIAEGKGLEAYDAVKSSFNINRFLDEADVVQNVRNFTKFRSNLRRKFNKISGGKLDESSFTKKISQEITRRKEVYRELAKKLGINIEVDEAFERLATQVLNDIPFKARNSALKSNALRDAVDRIILSQSPDALKVGERSTDRWWIGKIFKGTSIGEALERNLNAVVNWPIKQARLFRSRNRVVRGFSNFITGQHINNRVYSNSTDFMSIEAIVEGASREALPYVNYINGLRVRLGGPAFREFDFLFLKLRQLGKLIGDIDEDVLPEEMIRIFGGDVNALKTELKNVQNLYTSFMKNALDEMAEAGAPVANANAARYIPNMIRGGLSAERAKKFVDGFVQIRTNQLLSGDATLDKDVLNSLGFIKIVKNDVVEAGGKPVLNKPFVVPEDSPFWVGNLEDSIKYAESVIKEGYEGLKRLDTGEAGTGTTVARSIGVIERIRRDPGDLTKIADNYFAMRGDHFGLPLGRNAADAATATGVAHAVADTDPLMNQMRRAYNQLNGMSAEERALYNLENPDLTVEDMLVDLDNAMAVRGSAIVSEVRQQMTSGDVKLRRKPMSQNQKIKYVSDRESYAGLSKGHESLLNKLDNLIAEGFLDEDAARVVMLAFVDVDPHKMMGMTFTHLDSIVDGGTLGIARSTKDFNGRPIEGGTIGLSLLRELEKGDYGDAVNVASILVHETAHLAFLSAPARMQATLQSLLIQTRNGENEIRRLFERAGIMDVDYALSNVHEFAAALAEVALVRNQLAVKNGPLKEFLYKFSQFFKKLIGDISILKKESDSIGYQVLGEEKFKAVKTAVKSWYDLSVDDAPTDRLQRAFGITEAEKIDEYGDVAYLADKKALTTKKEQLQVALELARRGGLDEAEYDDFVKLQNLSPDAMDEKQISRLMELSEKRNKVQVAGKEVDLQDQLTKLEQELDSINETLQRLETKVDPGVRDAPVSPYTKNTLPQNEDIIRQNNRKIEQLRDKHLKEDDVIFLELMDEKGPGKLTDSNIQRIRQLESSIPEEDLTKIKAFEKENAQAQEVIDTRKATAKAATKEKEAIPNQEKLVASLTTKLKENKEILARKEAPGVRGISEEELDYYRNLIEFEENRLAEEKAKLRSMKERKEAGLSVLEETPAPISKAVEEKPAAKAAEADPTEAAAPEKISFNFKRKKDEYGDPYQVTTVNGRPLEIERNTSGVGDENGWFIRNFETITGPEARAANIDSQTERMITAQQGGGLVATNRAEMEEHIQNLIDNNRIYYDVDRRAWRPIEARDVSNASTSTSSSATTTKKVTVVKPKEEPEVTLKIRTTDKDGKVQPSRSVSGKRSDIEDSVKAKGETIVTEEDKTLTPADPKKGKFKGMFSKSGKQAEPTEEQASDPTFLKETLDAVTERFINGRKLTATVSKQLEAFTEVLFGKLFKNEAWPTINGRRMSQDEIFLAASNKDTVKAQTVTIKKRGPGGDEQGLRVQSSLTKEEKARRDVLSAKKKSGKTLTNAEEQEFARIAGRSRLVERGESAEISLSSAQSGEAVSRNLSEADEELSVLIDAGLHSNSPAAQKAAAKLVNARKFMNALRAREGALQAGERGGYKLTDDQVTSIAEETGLTEAAIKRHNQKEGLFDLKHVKQLSDTIADETSEESKIFGRSQAAKLKAQREAAEIDEIVTSHPAVADDIAEVSADNTKATPKATTNKYDNATDTEFLGVPGYTRMTQEEFDRIVDSHDDLMMFMKNIRDWDMPNPGEGVSFAREAKDYFMARKGISVESSPPFVREEIDISTPRTNDAGELMEADETLVQSSQFRNSSGAMIRVDSFKEESDGIVYLNPHFGEGRFTNPNISFEGGPSNALRTLNEVMDESLDAADNTNTNVIISHRDGKNSTVYSRSAIRRRSDLESKGWKIIESPYDGQVILVRKGSPEADNLDGVMDAAWRYHQKSLSEMSDNIEAEADELIRAKKITKDEYKAQRQVAVDLFQQQKQELKKGPPSKRAKPVEEPKAVDPEASTPRVEEPEAPTPRVEEPDELLAALNRLKEATEAPAPRVEEPEVPAPRVEEPDTPEGLQSLVDNISERVETLRQAQARREMPLGSETLAKITSERGTVSIGSIQQGMKISYKKAKKMFEDLVNAGYLAREDDAPFGRIVDLRDEPGTRTGPQRLPDGDEQDFRRPSDKDLRARYEEDAAKRLVEDNANADEQKAFDRLAEQTAEADAELSPLKQAYLFILIRKFGVRDYNELNQTRLGLDKLEPDELLAALNRLKEATEGMVDRKGTKGIENIPDPPGTRKGSIRGKGGNEQDFRRPSDKDLRARYEEEAKARVERDDISDEALFEGMEGPAPRKPAELNDDELIEIGSSLEAKLSKEGSLSPEERMLYVEVNAEITFRSRKPLDTTPDAPKPKAPADAGDGAPPPKPPKSPAGAGDAPEPKKPSDIIDALDEYFARKNEAQVEAGSFNKAHRLAGKGTLAELYASAVKGDNMDIFSEEWMKGLERVGRQVMPPLRVAAYDYLDHAGGNFKHSHMANPSDLNVKIQTLDDIQMPHRTFDIRDFDNLDGSTREGGEELASLFAEAGNSMEHIIRYADTHLASTRIQKALNDLFGFKGATMSDMFNEIENALTLNLKTDKTGKKRTITERDFDREVNQYMESLRELYLRSRGFNPQRTREFSQASRITQNIAYSILGAKFAMSVLFVEVPMTILRTSGLNPIKLIRNTGIITGSLLDAARGEAVKYKPVQRFMSSLGLDKRIMKETVEDLAYSTQNLRSSSMAKFGAGGDAMEDGELMTSVAERLKTHVNNVRSGLAGEGHSDPSWLKRLADGVEAFTGATADLTGLASGMLPVTNAVRTVAANQAKATLLKHSDKLIVLSKEIAGRELTLKQIQGIARELGIPQTLATYAAESGLLRPGVMQELMAASGLNTRSAGRELDLNQLGESLAGRSSDANSGVVSLEFSQIARNRVRVQDSVLPSLNQYIMFVTQEMSPELRGTMRFQGMNPLVDMLFQMLSYPMAAYQALVGNGVRARGTMMTAGILTSLTAFEYINRNTQAALFKEDEDRRKQAIENLTTMPDMNKVIEVLATYGASSPLFGSVGPYMRDLVGNTVLRAMQSSERNFPVRPFSSPAVSMIQKTYGRLSRFAGNLGSYVGGGPGAEKRLSSSFSDVAETAGEILPFNALPIQLAQAPFREGMKATAVGMTAGSSRNIPYLSHPTLEDLGYFKWMGSAQQPHGWDEVDYQDDRLIPTPPPMEEEPVEKKQEPKAPPSQRPQSSAPSSPSEGLADRLN